VKQGLVKLFGELVQIDEWHFVTQNVVPPSEIAALPTVTRNDRKKEAGNDRKMRRGMKAS